VDTSKYAVMFMQDDARYDFYSKDLGSCACFHRDTATPRQGLQAPTLDTHLRCSTIRITPRYMHVDAAWSLAIAAARVHHVCRARLPLARCCRRAAHPVTLTLPRPVTTFPLTQALFQMGLRPETAFSCALRFLFTPNAEVESAFSAEFAELRSAVRDPDRFVVNLQMRLGDSIFFQHSDDPEQVDRHFQSVQHYVTCPKQIAASRGIAPDQVGRARACLSAADTTRSRGCER
jgi:hypothetical protein